jgi:hypothetical protein
LTPTPTGTLILSALSPAEMWVGSETGSVDGIRFDLLAKVSLNGSLIGSGQLDSVPGGAKSFNDATLDAIQLNLTAPVPVSSGQVLSIQVLVRNACSGSGGSSGKAKLWYNGQPIDSGPAADAGSRFDATIGGSSRDYFLRNGFLLSTAAASSRTSIEAPVGARCGAFQPFGTWSISLP